MDSNSFIRDIQQSTSLNDHVRYVEDYGDWMYENRDSLMPLLDKFKPESHIVPNAALLKNLFLSTSSNKTLLVERCHAVFKSVSSTLPRRALTIIRGLTAEYVDFLIEASTPRVGIKPISKVIKASQTSKEVLTIFHSDLLQLCLAANYFEPALKLLANPILDFDRNGAQTSRDYLLTFYYAGLMYCAIKEYPKALQHFELALMLPAYTPNQIYIQAMKKSILVSLIINGSYECRNHENYLRPYLDLVKAFESSKADKLEAVITEHKELFKSEANLGLVEQLRERMAKFEIIHFTKTYLTMTLRDLANRLGIVDLGRVELMLVEMINDAEIFAKIDKANETIHFFDDPETYESSDVLLKINEKISQCNELEKYLKAYSDSLMLNPQYVSYLVDQESKSSKVSQIA